MPDPSESEKLARAVATDLATASADFAYTFSAAFHARPKYALKDLRTMQINVRDIGQRDLGRFTRAEIKVEYDIEITARIQLAGASSESELAKMKLLREQLSDYYWFDRPTLCEQTLSAIKSAEVGEDAEYNEQSVGLLAMVLTFEGSRERRNNG